jgi:hypothetical protein
VVIEPVDGGAGIVRRGGVIGAGPGEDRRILSFVRPGAYRVSVDRKRWIAIRVPAWPAKRSIDLRRRLSRASG